MTNNSPLGMRQGGQVCNTVVQTCGIQDKAPSVPEPTQLGCVSSAAHLHHLNAILLCRLLLLLGLHFGQDACRGGC